MVRFTVYRNRSLSMRGNQLFFAITLCVSFTIAFLFAWQGLWLVLPFTGIEMLVLGLALYFCVNKLSRVETITISARDIKICVSQRNKAQQCYSFPKAWARATIFPSPLTRQRQQLWLGAKQSKVEIGSSLSDNEKRQLANAINRAINENLTG